MIDAYAKICRLMGPVGAGQTTKMCNQIAIAGLVQGLSESLHFAEKAGLSFFKPRFYGVLGRTDHLRSF